MLFSTRRVIVMMSLLLVATVCAQEKAVKDSISPVLQEKIELAVKAEKELMKKEIIKVNEQVKNKELTEEEAKLAKKEIANKYAIKIKEGTDNIIKENVSEKNSVEFSLLGGRLFRITKSSDSIKKTSRKKDYRTYSGIVVAAGFNNTIQEGKSLNDSDYKAGGSRFFELGFAWKTRVFKESNWLRFGYGVSLQYNSLKPKDNQYFVRNNDVTSLQIHPYDLKKSKIRTTNLVVPISFEFGASEKIDKGNYSVFPVHQSFKFTIGGYAGIRIGTIQKLKYKANGEREKNKSRNHYNMNDFVYGVTVGIARNGVGLYMKYDLNPLFSSPNIKQNNISLGVKYELF
ncbi:MAG: hypothetical protein HRT69_01095 [Flavobacteriaceae bacterium]|nr:hypothetical protein [Flavobacteriaceae bacterium]